MPAKSKKSGRRSPSPKRATRAKRSKRSPSPKRRLSGGYGSADSFAAWKAMQASAAKMYDVPAGPMPAGVSAPWYKPAAAPLGISRAVSGPATGPAGLFIDPTSASPPSGLSALIQSMGSYFSDAASTTAGWLKSWGSPAIDASMAFLKNNSIGAVVGLGGVPNYAVILPLVALAATAGGVMALKRYAGKSMTEKDFIALQDELAADPAKGAAMFEELIKAPNGMCLLLSVAKEDQVRALIAASGVMSERELARHIAQCAATRGKAHGMRSPRAASEVKVAILNDAARQADAVANAVQAAALRNAAPLAAARPMSPFNRYRAQFAKLGAQPAPVVRAAAVEAPVERFAPPRSSAAEEASIKAAVVRAQAEIKARAGARMAQLARAKAPALGVRAKVAPALGVRARAAPAPALGVARARAAAAAAAAARSRSKSRSRSRSPVPAKRRR